MQLVQLPFEIKSFLFLSSFVVGLLLWIDLCWDLPLQQSQLLNDLSKTFLKVSCLINAAYISSLMGFGLMPC